MVFLPSQACWMVPFSSRLIGIRFILASCTNIFSISRFYTSKMKGLWQKDVPSMKNLSSLIGSKFLPRQICCDNAIFVLINFFAIFLLPSSTNIFIQIFWLARVKLACTWNHGFKWKYTILPSHKALDTTCNKLR